MESMIVSALDVVDEETTQDAAVDDEIVTEDEPLSDQTVKEESGGDENAETTEDEPKQTDTDTSVENDVQEDPVSAQSDSVEGQSGDTVVYETVATVAVEDRPILSTPINDYTVTEGLLLAILIVLLGRMIFDFGKRFF